MKSLWNKWDRISAQEVEVIKLDDLEVASAQKKSVRKERFTTTDKIKARSAKKSPAGSRSQQSQQHSKTSTTKPPATKDVDKKKKEAKKAPKHTAESGVEESGPVLYSGFDGRLNGKLPPGYNKPSVTIDDERRSWICSSLQAASSRELGTDEK